METPVPRCPKCGSDLVGFTTNPDNPGPRPEFCFSCAAKWTRDGERVWNVRDERGVPIRRMRPRTA